MLRFTALIAAMVATQATAANLSAADEAAAFQAAGFTRHGKQWQSGCGDPGTASYTPGTIEQVRDLNGDGQPEAVITESSSFCYGDPGMAFVLVSKQPGGGWKRVAGETGAPNFLPTKGAGGWPDIEVGGPGFCFPVQRWNGREYARIGFQYDGKPCRP